MDNLWRGRNSQRANNRLDETLGFLVQIEGLTEPVYILIEGLDPESILQALQALQITWNVDEFGDIIQVSDQIAAYHSQGIGFGVLVKLYALSNASGVPVEDLIAEFQSGVGIGELFQAYGGKPALVGVGHVRQQLKNQTQTTTTQQNGNGNGNGNGNTKSQNKNKSNKKNRD